MTKIFCESTGCTWIKDGACTLKVVEMEDHSETNELTEKIRCVSARPIDGRGWHGATYGVLKEGSEDYF